MRVWRRSHFCEDNLQPGGSAALTEVLIMPRISGQTTLYRMLMMALVAIAPALLLAACERETDTAAPAARPVRTVTVEKRETGRPLTFTGRIEAEDEVSVAFRISGGLLENSGKLGDRVQTGQVMARLETTERVERPAAGAGRARGRSGQLDAGAQSFRTPGDASCTGMDDPGQFRMSRRRRNKPLNRK